MFELRLPLLALLIGCGPVMLPASELDPGATFAAHQVHNGFRIDRLQGGGTGVVVVGGPPGMVVVVATGQLPALQASQQLAARPTQAAPPFGAAHLLALALTEHFVTPVAVVRQHETKPGVPQVDFTAHFTTARLHCFDRLPFLTLALATPATHFTYCL